MENNSQPPFHVGQRVVALKTHPQLMFKKGDIFLVTEIRQTICRCNSWDIRIGNILGKGYGSICDVCGISVSYSGPLWFDAARFAPYNPPRHVEIAEDILKMEIVEERADTLERVLND